MRTHIAGRGPRLLSISLEVRTIDPLGLCMPALMTTRSLARFRAGAARVGSTPPAGRAIDPIRFQTDTTTAPLHCCAIGITVLLRACVGRLRRCTAEKNYWDRPAGRVGVCACMHAASHQQRVGGIRRHSAGRCCGLGEHHPPPLLRCHLKPLLLTSIVYWEQAYIPRVDEPAC
jgi:hypothetical protein